jgi:capsular polysaccharide biosynthesis protein
MNMIEQEQPLTLKRLIAQTKRWLPFIIAACIIAAGATFVMTRGRIPEYQATSTLLIGIADQQPNRNDAVNAGQGLARTYARTFNDAAFYERAVKDLGLDFSAAKLQSGVKVFAVSSTPLIDIEVTWSSREEAVRFANYLATLFVEQRRSQSLAGLTQTLEETRQRRLTVEQRLSEIRPRDYDTPEAAALRKELDQLVLREQAIEEQASDVRKQIDIVSYASSTEKVGIANLQIAIISIVGSGAAALSLAILVELLMPTLLSEDIARRLGFSLPVYLRTRRKSQGKIWNVLRSSADSSTSQTLRLLAGRIPAEAKVVMVAGVGKRTDSSSVAISLAAACVEDGRKVLLLDANMDQPRLSALLNLPVTVGLQQLLQGKGQLDGALLATEITGVSLLGAEPNDSRASQSINESAMLAQLLTTLQERFDLIIVDLFEPLQHALSQRLITATDVLVLVAHEQAVRPAVLQPYGTWIQQKMPNQAPTFIIYNGDADAKRTPSALRPASVALPHAGGQR